MQLHAKYLSFVAHISILTDWRISLSIQLGLFSEFAMTLPGSCIHACCGESVPILCGSLKSGILCRLTSSVLPFYLPHPFQLQHLFMYTKSTDFIHRHSSQLLPIPYSSPVPSVDKEMVKQR